MRRVGTWVPLMVALLALAGCVGSQDSKSAQDALATTSAPPPEATESTGSIVGVVTDPEGLPVGSVQVDIVEPFTHAETDQAGAYTFNELAPGKYTVVFGRVGFTQIAKQAKVAVGEITRLDAVMEPLVIAPDPYHESFSKEAYIYVGQYTVQLVQNFVNNSNVNGLLCDPCRFDLLVPDNVTSAMTEGMYEKSVNAPLVNDQFGVVFWRNYSDTSYGSTIILQYFQPPRTSFKWSEGAVDILNQQEEVRMQVHGTAPTAGINVNQRVEVWQTWGFNGNLPSGFTALPPE